MNNNSKTTEKSLRSYDWSGHCILVVEDDFYNYKFLEGWVGMMKAEAIWAESGPEAIELCKERKDISVVIMDVQLPRMNGYDATRFIKECRPDLPVIAATASDLEEERIKSEEAGCDGFIEKPIDIKKLTKIVEELLPGSK